MFWFKCHIIMRLSASCRYQQLEHVSGKTKQNAKTIQPGRLRTISYQFSAKGAIIFLTLMRTSQWIKVVDGWGWNCIPQRTREQHVLSMKPARYQTRKIPCIPSSTVWVVLIGLVRDQNWDLCIYKTCALISNNEPLPPDVPLISSGCLFEYM